MALILSGDTGVPASGMPTGSVIQTVSATTSTAVTATSSTYVDSGVTAAITPISSTSKIHVQIMMHCEIDATNNIGGNLRLYRGSTLIWDGQNSGTIYLYGSTGGAMQLSVQVPILYLDSPATTSSTTYKVQGNLSTGSQFIMQWQSIPSTIVLQEIKG